VAVRDTSISQLDLFGDSSEEVWSYTRLKSLRRCALEYKVRWLEGRGALFQPSSTDVRAGRLLHHIVREYYRRPWAPRPYQSLLQVYEKLAPRTAEWRDDLRGEGRVLAALRLFADSLASSFRCVALEVGCKTRIAETRFAGQADLIYQAQDHPPVYGILEFKLNEVEVSNPDPSEKFLQCIIYYLGLPEQFRQFASLASTYVFDSGELLTAQIEPAMVERVTHIVESTLLRAKGPDFPPTLNPFCPSCGFQNLCPAYSKR
jgi:PD-(D/E)XK nuclease superfamily